MTAIILSLILIILIITAIYLKRAINDREQVLATAAPTTTTVTATTTQTPTTTQMAPVTTTETTTQHTHRHIETITAIATCEIDGTKTFTCDCGDTYTESIPAIGHSFTKYIYNNDATYTADGTETATCICGQSDTRTASGTKLTYSYKDFEKTMYAKTKVNVRDLPSTDGTKIGSLVEAQSVTVTGQCIETNWYRIKYKDSTGYVSGKYLVADNPKSDDIDENTEYTFTDKIIEEAYTTAQIDVLNLPSKFGQKVGELGASEEIFITGICNETGWYRISYHLRFIGKHIPAYIPPEYVTMTPPTN